MRLTNLLSAALLFTVCCQTPTTDYTLWVDPRIGTGGHGHIFVGANVPFGMVQLGPTQLPKGWDWCSGYHQSDTTVMGFAHTHLSGTGIGDLGDIALLPYTGQGMKTPEGRLYSTFSHDREQIRPGYYSVHLDSYGIEAELTATPRAGVHRYNYPDGCSEAKLSVDLTYAIGWDSLVRKTMRQIDTKSISGSRHSTGWAKDHHIYFHAEFSAPIHTIDTLSGELTFDLRHDRTLMVRVGISPTSAERAAQNLHTEIPDWDFDHVSHEAHTAWNSELSKIRIETSDQSVKRIFYTALYHTMIAPSLFSDCADQDPAYTTFSLWDTYRAAHPLMTLIHPERTNEVINTMLSIYDHQGKLPVWHLAGNETDCMVGNPAIPVVADAILKGYDGFDHERAYQALKASAMCDDRGQKLRREYGYIPCDQVAESVSMDLEYALADWCVAQVAKKLGKEDDYRYFIERSKGYTRHFDLKDRFMKGVDTQGAFRKPFNPFESIHMESDFTEGNAWQYTWLVPHDVEGLISLFGSQTAFEQKLDSLFTISGNMGSRASNDISGLIGQYAHGNEPSHHILYLYSMIGHRDKAAPHLRHILTELYHDSPDGLSGNEDVGQMSAWYVLSSMGIYQAEPAGGRFYFGSPLVDRAELTLGGGTFEIIAHNNSPENCYIRAIRLNGKPYEKPYIDFSDLQSGGKLEFEMSNQSRCNP